MIDSLKWLHHEGISQSKVLTKPHTDTSVAAIHQIAATLSD